MTVGAGASGSSSTAPAAFYNGNVDLEECEIYNFLILDHNTFEVIHSHQLGHNEQVRSPYSIY